MRPPLTWMPRVTFYQYSCIHPRVSQCTVYGLSYGIPRCPFFRGRGSLSGFINLSKMISVHLDPAARPYRLASSVAHASRNPSRNPLERERGNGRGGRLSEGRAEGRRGFKRGASILTLEGAFRLEGRSAFPLSIVTLVILVFSVVSKCGRAGVSLSLSCPLSFSPLFLLFFTGTADKGVRGFLRISCTYRDAYRALCITRAGNIMRPLLRREERSSSFLRLLPSPLSLLNAVDRSGSHGRRLMLICICPSRIRFTVFKHRIRDLASGRPRLARPKRRFAAVVFCAPLTSTLPFMLNVNVGMTTSTLTSTPMLL
jgi:hypothetical protein